MQHSSRNGGDARAWRRVALGTVLFMAVVLVGLVSVALYVANDGARPATEDTTAVLPAHESVLPYYGRVGDSPFTKSKADSKSIDERFTIELAVAREQHIAERMIEKYEKLGINAYFTPFSRDGVVLYRVRTGLFPKPDEARRALAKLAADHDFKGKVVKLQ